MEWISVLFNYDGETRMLETSHGVKGFNIPVNIIVKDNKITGT